MPPELAKSASATALASGAPGSSMATSGNMLADRRYVYACDSLAQGDFEAAIDLCEQILELTPHWSPAWMRLGEAHEKADALAKAAAAYEQVLIHDPSGVLGANIKLASLGHAAAPFTAPPAYVQGLFDQYAARFDEHLVHALGYRGPGELLRAINEVCTRRGMAGHFGVVYDLGCGTGLMGKALSGRFDSISGVDLAPRMIQIAQRTGVYNHLAVADCTDFLRLKGEKSCDLVIAADVFVYMGDLAAVFAQSARVLDANGLFAFSIQAQPAGETADYSVGADMRFAHSLSYLQKLAAENLLRIEVMESIILRKDRGAGVPAYVLVLARN